MKRILISLLFIIISLFLISCNKEDSNKDNPSDDPVIDDPVTLEKIEVVSLGKTTYMMGEEFNPSGFVLKAFFSDESSKTIGLTLDMLTIDMTKAGENTAKVSYTFEGVTKEATFKYTIEEVKPVALECTKYGDTIYWEGKAFDISDYEFILRYSDDTFIPVDTKDVKVVNSKFDENTTDEGIEVEVCAYITIDNVTFDCILKVMNYSEWIYEEKMIEFNDEYIIEYVRLSAEVPEVVQNITSITLLDSSSLPLNNYILSWQSSNTNVIDTQGKIEADEVDKSVTLTLKVRRGTTVIQEFTFDVLVKGLGPVQFPTYDPTQKQVFAYSYEGTFISLTDSAAGKINFYNYCFGNISDDHELTLAGLNHLKEVLSYRRKYGIRVILSIKNGPWAETVSNDEYFKKFTDSIINAIDTYHFDGIDMDWEFPKKNTEVSLFTKLIQGTRAAMDAYKPGLFLTCALIGGGSVTNVKEYYDCPAIKDYINYAHIMTYDLNVSSQASHHTNPLAGRAYSAEGSISFYSGAGMPYEKIVIGAGFYGKISELTNPYDQATERVLNAPVKSTVAIKYSSIKRNYMTDPSYVEYYDSRCGAYYLTNGINFITYDNPQSIYTKGQLVQRYNLGGMMFWDLGSDDTFELLNAVYGVICDINYGRM